jgi:mitogen-activated protein kinase kinase kinase
VGKGGFARPTTAAGTVSIPSGSSQAAASGQVIPFEEVMRKTVKFIGDDGISKMVYVDGAKDTYEVLLRTLRKFGKLAMNRFPEPNKASRNEYGELYAEMEGYRVFAGKADGSGQHS